MAGKVGDKDVQPAKDKPIPPIGTWIGIGVAAGIGSAAIAAALLYASDRKTKPRVK